jgi:hypothetical protein
VDVSPDSLIIEITGAEEKVDGFVEMLRPYGVLEMARRDASRWRGATGRPRSRVRRTHEISAVLDEGVSFPLRSKRWPGCNTTRIADLAPIRASKVAIIGYGFAGARAMR